MVAGELGGVEVDGAPEDEEPFEMSPGHQDSLLSAGLDLADDEAPPTDPGYTPELDETDDEVIEKVAAAMAAPGGLSGEPGGSRPKRLPPPLVAAMPR